MSILNDLRGLVFQRRIARATERIADALDEFRTIERQRWQKEAHVTGKPIQKTVIESFDVAAANELWRREQEAAEVGGIIED